VLFQSEQVAIRGSGIDADEDRPTGLVDLVVDAGLDAFTAAIDKCLAELPTTHKPAMDSLLTHNFQTFDSVSVVAA
jgi:hypothetical protein